MTTERRNPQDPMIEEQNQNNQAQGPEGNPQQNQGDKGGDRQETPGQERTRGEFPNNEDLPEDEGDLTDEGANENRGEPVGSTANAQRVEDRQTGSRSGESSGPG